MGSTTSLLLTKRKIRPSKFLLSPEPHFGSWQALNDLVATAHANDLKILIDLVVNHAGYNAMIVGTEPEHTVLKLHIGRLGDPLERVHRSHG